MKKIIVALLAAANITAAFAGGLLTNTNQNAAFLRLPARDAAIDIDGVYNNPAGVVFMSEGFHLGLNWQAAWQTREIKSTNPDLYPMNLNDPSVTKTFKGDAKAPVIPSVQAAYNTGKWSFQFNFAVHGGGGKCTFDEGIGTFDEALGEIAASLKPFGANGYKANSYMQGKQYYFGFTLGAAYKVTDNLAVYGGLRALYGSASYQATIKNILVNANVQVQPGVTMPVDVPFNQYLAGAIAQLEPVKDVPGYADKYYALQGLNKYSEGVDLMADQEGFGIAPIIGVDYKVGNFNFAGRYEFRTKMSLKNKSTLQEAGVLKPLAKFEDGTSFREDNPAMLSLGAEWSVLPNVRLDLGYHHFYDQESKKYADAQKALDGGTNEYLFGAGWDITNKLTVSAGAQITRYGLTDAFMNDMSFVVNSWSWGAGFEYKITDKVKAQLAYFRTNYDNRNTAANAKGSVNEYTRSNDVLGLGVSLDF